MNLPKWVPLFRGGTANLAVLGGNLPPSLARETFCDPVTLNALGCRAGRPTERASGPFHPVHLLKPKSELRLRSMACALRCLERRSLSLATKGTVIVQVEDIGPGANVFPRRGQLAHVTG